MIDFGLNAFDDLQRWQDEGVDVLIREPGGDKVLMTIKVCGPDSAQQARATERDAEELSVRGSVHPLTREENTERGNRFLARCCMGWDAKDRNGNEIPFTEDAVYELISRYKLIRAEIDNVAGNRARFIKRSQTA